MAASVSGNELRMPLAGTGIRDACLAIRPDGRSESRFAPLTLPRWDVDADTCSLLAR